MKTNIFDYESYKKYLSHWIEGQPFNGRGIRSKFAENSGCKNAYVSQVLSGSAHFSLEQAEKISRFIGHRKDEHRCFLLLVQFERAGTASLRAHFKEQLEQERERQLALKNRVNARALSEDEQEIYFGEWCYAAVHVALTIPRLRNPEAIARYLGLPRRKVTEVLRYLTRTGLANYSSAGQYTVGKVRIHLGHDSSMIARHHSNWRLQALRSLDAIRADDQHYSSVVTITQADALKIRKEILKLIEASNQIVSDAKEEEIYAFSLDLFHLGQDE